MGFELILKIESVNFELIKELDEFVFCSNLKREIKSL